MFAGFLEESKIIVSLLIPYLLLLGVIGAGYLGGIIFSRILRLIVKRFPFHALPVYIRYMRQPVRILVSLVVVYLVSRSAFIPDLDEEIIASVLRILFIADATWILLGILHVGEAYLKNRLHLDAADNLRARKIFTQLGILRRISAFVIVLLGTGVLLTSFDGIRQLGTTLLASAGVVGIILGVAAQKTIGLVLAGLQVALTQPIRIDDVLIVEGEWGRVEEIALTYVVVKIWDERRLVLPISYFIEKPFQNWTRSSAQLIGSVYLYADFTFNVDPLREELARILPEIAEWDGRVQVIQVTDLSERGQELRVLVSSTDAPKLWDLRCKVRERLLTYMQKNYPENLPRIRASLENRVKEGENQS